ncbi:DUF2391 family protein [Natronomonas sp. EA1]|uniref:DUF2391 family protein n=1 Tax=Natronomonas sp. EA1 TaxID=3421655 RepID=UPI003EBA4F12
MAGPRRRFMVADIAQQMVGGFLLAGPFVVTAEVWQLASEMSLLQGGLTALIVFVIGYGALYQADDRDPDRERAIAGVPLRFLSLMVVSFGAVLILALVFNAPATFLTDLGVPQEDWPYTTATAVAIGSVFSVVGAATADSVF